MTTSEEALESTLWQVMALCRVTCLAPVRFIELVTLAAQRYAAGDSPTLTELRREVLHRDGGGPPGQDLASDCGGDGGAAHEPIASRSTAAGPAIAAVGGATLSTGPVVPIRRKGRGKSHPQDVDKNRPGTIGPRQYRILNDKLTELGIKDRANRLGLVAEIIGREVPSSNDLSYTEAGKVLEMLNARTKTEARG